MSRHFLHIQEVTSPVAPLPFFNISHRKPFPAGICCGLRDGARKALWRGRVLSTEAIQAVQFLKFAKSQPSIQPSQHSSSCNGSDRVEEVLKTRIGRLLKADQIAVLSELRRQNEWQLALQVFAFVQREVQYKPDLSLYGDMIFMLGKNKLIEHAEELFNWIRDAGLEPDTRVYTEMIGAFLQVGMPEKAMEVYNLMKDSGCSPDQLTLTILIRNLEKAGVEDLASLVRKDCMDYVDHPEKFLKEVSKKYPKRKSIKII